MSAAEPFFDTNVLLYLLTDDAAKADKAEALVAGGGAVSVQVLNEFANVAVRKFGAPWSVVREALEVLRLTLQVEPLTVSTHELALDIAERYKLGLYDSLILSAAKLAGCALVYSEDMQDGQAIEGVVIKNPFAGG